MSYPRLSTTLHWCMSPRLNRAIKVHLKMSYLNLSSTRSQPLALMLNRAILVCREMSYLKLLSTLPRHHASRLTRELTVHLEMLSRYHRLTTVTMVVVKLYVLLRIITLYHEGSCKLAKGITKLPTWCQQVRSFHIYLYDFCFDSQIFDIRLPYSAWAATRGAYCISASFKEWRDFVPA